MSRTLNNLNARKVEALLKHGDSAAKPGWYSDGGGLYLKIDKPRERKDGEGYSQAKRWVFVFFESGKRREMGLGGAAEKSLADARKERDEARKEHEGGRDPIAERRSALRRLGGPIYSRAEARLEKCQARLAMG
jgi:Arm DNA-binding domain